MFGAFRPTAPLSGGLLWKIPWRLSGPRKLRHRRRLRRVDNVVAVLDNALKRQAASSAYPALSSSWAQPRQPPNQHPDESGVAAAETKPEELSSTIEDQAMLKRDQNADQEARRHGRGPKQGEMVPEFTEQGVEIASDQYLVDKAMQLGTVKVIERWKAEMPTEQEMLPRDKYTMFDKKAKKYRKGVHKLPKWTRVSQRLNPPGY